MYSPLIPIMLCIFQIYPYDCSGRGLWSKIFSEVVLKAIESAICSPNVIGQVTTNNFCKCEHWKLMSCKCHFIRHFFIPQKEIIYAYIISFWCMCIIRGPLFHLNFSHIVKWFKIVFAFFLLKKKTTSRQIISRLIDDVLHWFFFGNMFARWFLTKRGLKFE